MFMLLLALCPCTFINILLKHAQRLKSSCFFGMFFVHSELCLLLHMTIIWLGYTFFLLASCLFFIWLQVQSGELIFFCIYLDCGRTGSCKRRHPKATNKKKYKLNASRTKYCSSIFYLPSSSGLEIIFRQCLQHFLFLESVNANCIMTRPIYCQRITSKRFILFFFQM